MIVHKYVGDWPKGSVDYWRVNKVHVVSIESINIELEQNSDEETVTINWKYEGPM